MPLVALYSPAVGRTMLGEPSDKGFSEGALHHGVIAASAGRLPDLKGIDDDCYRIENHAAAAVRLARGEARRPVLSQGSYARNLL
jgi:hypothetical protein